MKPGTFIALTYAQPIRQAVNKKRTIKIQPSHLNQFNNPYKSSTTIRFSTAPAKRDKRSQRIHVTISIDVVYFCALLLHTCKRCAEQLTTHCIDVDNAQQRIGSLHHHSSALPPNIYAQICDDSTRFHLIKHSMLFAYICVISSAYLPSELAFTRSFPLCQLNLHI
uniref:Uncharacterized protein n=1 Tax=Ascaris lumbricoides TaxID=6252 RepID=A0A0M3HVE9_ASCLU